MPSIPFEALHIDLHRVEPIDFPVVHILIEGEERDAHLARDIFLGNLIPARRVAARVAAIEEEFD